MTEPAPPLPALSGADQRELVDALLDAFPSPDALKQFVRLWLDKNLDEIAGNAGLRTVVFELIRHTESHGTTGALLSAAIAARPGNPKLRAFMQKRGLPVPVLKVTPPGPGPTPAWRRALLLAAAGVLALLALGWLFRDKLWPPELPAVAPSATSSALPALGAIQPFASNTRGIVLAGPRGADDAAAKLYDQLGTQHAPQRVLLEPPSSHDELLRKAELAGAVLVVELGQDGKRAQIHPLGELAKDALFQGPIEVEPAREGAALVINGLARSSGKHPAMQVDTDACPRRDPQRRLDRFDLLALLVVPSCWSEVIDSRVFQAACGLHRDPADETCALALYLDAEHNGDSNPGAALLLLGELFEHGPARFKPAARLALAGLECRDKATVGKATETILDFAKSSQPCVLAQLPGIASCIRTTAGATPEMGSTGAEEGSAVTPRSIESWPIDPKKTCPNAERARAMARRAYWRSRRELWPAAASEYREAFLEYSNPAYAMSRAEMLLKQKLPLEATEALEPLRSLTMKDWTQESRRALLRWIAARQAKDLPALAEAEDALMKLFSTRPDGGAPTAPVDKDLRELACGKGAGGLCVYDVLRAWSSSPETLKQSLHVR